MWPFQKKQERLPTPLQYLSDSYQELVYAIAKHEVKRWQANHEISWYVKPVQYELAKVGVHLSLADCAVLVSQIKQETSQSY